MLMSRNNIRIIFFLLAVTVFSVAAIRKDANNYLGATFIPPSEQRSGDAQKGFDYVVTGDYLKSGIAYSYYSLINPKDKSNQLNRSGKNALLPYSFNLIKNADSLEIVVPNCLQCHAQVFDGQLYVGLGNTFLDFSRIHQSEKMAGNIAAGIMHTFSPAKYKAAEPFLRSFRTIYPHLKTEVQGVNAADRLAGLLVAHRDPVTLQWSDQPVLDIPDEVVPTDVPAWWLLKKKNAMFYNGFGRGDFGKFLMLSNLLTVSDSSEARETSAHFGDVLAFIKSINPPKYTGSINSQLAAKGETIFVNNCSKCHGTYGSNPSYPNLLIDEKVIRTDSLLFTSNYQNPQFIEWFNKSWYAQGAQGARLQPGNGYVAPPLDGIWITAPYLHNGSVPSLETLLNSSKRPRYWQRNFKHPVYDYEEVGWKYETKQKPEGRKTYNTTLKGYSNSGHTFGDHLTDEERKALIEYLKTI